MPSPMFLEATLLPKCLLVPRFPATLLIFHQNTKKTSLFQHTAFIIPAGSCLPESDGDLKEVHYSSLCFSRQCSPACSQQRPTPRLRGTAVWPKYVDMWGTQNEPKNHTQLSVCTSLADSYSSSQETAARRAEVCSCSGV